MFCVPNLVPLSMIPMSKAPTYEAQFGVEIVYQIGYSRGCTQLGTVFHIPAIFSRLIGILRPGQVAPGREEKVRGQRGADLSRSNNVINHPLIKQKCGSSK